MNDLPISPVPEIKNRGALKIAAIYLVTGSLWILLSDKLVAVLTNDPATLTRLSIFKGWLYVIITAVLFFWLIRREMNALSASEEQKRSSEARYRGLFENMLEGYAHCRMLFENGLPVDFIYLDVNHAFEQLTGLRDVVGKKVSEVIPGLQVTNPELFTIYGRVAQSGSPEKFESYLDQLETWFSVSVYCPQKEQFIAVFDNITERKQTEKALQTSERTLKLFVEYAPAAIAMFDRDMRYVAASRRYYFDYRLPQANIIGHSHYEIFPEIPEHLKEIYRRCLAGAVEKCDEDPFQRQDGTLDWVHWEMYPWYEKSGETGGVILFSEVITERKKTQEELRLSEERYRTLAEAAQDSIFIIDPNDRLQYVNPAGARLLGQAQQALVGRKRAEFFPLQVSEVQTNNIEKVLQTGEPLFDENSIPTPFGEIWLNTSLVPLRDAGGKVNAVLGISRDITERKQAEAAIRELYDQLELRVQERTAELSDLYNNAPCGYHSLDGDGLIIRINDTELNWLGYRREELIGKVKMYELMTPASVQAFYINFPIFKERGRVDDLQIDLVRKDGSLLPVLLSGTAIKDAQGRFLMSRTTMIDHTERKRAEEAMQELQAKLEAANKELEAFAYSVSHDLRAPLRAIDGFSRILTQDYAAQLDAEGNRLLDIIRTNTRKMDELISDMLALSRVSRIDLSFSAIDMTALVHAILDEVAPPEVRQKFTFVIDPLPEALGDPTLLRQVWINYLSNAVKYTLPQPERRIEVGGYTENGMNVYYVRDSGVGFNPEFTHKLFGVFQRLHKAEEFEGTGVGLAIVQRIVERHGGQCWAEGKIDQGATFYFSIPAGG